MDAASFLAGFASGILTALLTGMAMARAILPKIVVVEKPTQATPAPEAKPDPTPETKLKVIAKTMWGDVHGK